MYSGKGASLKLQIGGGRGSTPQMKIELYFLNSLTYEWDLVLTDYRS